MATNENLKMIFRKYKEQLTLKDYFICSFTSGAIASIVTTPLDNIKTRLNIQKLFKGLTIKKIEEKNPNQPLGL